jgi:hypothetical protein
MEIRKKDPCKQYEQVVYLKSSLKIVFRLALYYYGEMSSSLIGGPIAFKQMEKFEVQTNIH